MMRIIPPSPLPLPRDPLHNRAYELPPRVLREMSPHRPPRQQLLPIRPLPHLQHIQLWRVHDPSLERLKESVRGVLVETLAPAVRDDDGNFVDFVLGVRVAVVC